MHASSKAQVQNLLFYSGFMSAMTVASAPLG